MGACTKIIALSAILSAPLVRGAVAKDLVSSLPGFEPFPTHFRVYSGFLDVTFDPAVAGYDGAKIHYQFQTSQRNETGDPVVAWHTGGPGGSSIYGQYAETGYFQVSTSAGQTINEHAWNRVANMLYLEAPAGSFLTPVDMHSGFSYCTKAGVRQATCSWNDKTQAEAYAHTLRAFFRVFPEFAAHDLYLAGESYAGQYIPNIAAHILADVPELPLKGVAVGNGCWGGTADSVACNGPNEDANTVALYFGKGLISSKMHADIQATCGFGGSSDSSEAGKGRHSLLATSPGCEKLLSAMDKAVGPHNVYNIYDNCPNLDLDRWLQLSGKSTRWLRNYMARNMVNPGAYAELDAMAAAGERALLLATAETTNYTNAAASASSAPANPKSGGGFDWTCGQFDALPIYFRRADVRAALNLPQSNHMGSTFQYASNGPASVTLYPALIKKIRVLIYNGDSDSCVPYIGNEEWTSSMADMGVVTELDPWHPWYASPAASSPAGYATSYSDSFQVPKNRPEAALTMFTGFLDGKMF